MSKDKKVMYYFLAFCFFVFSLTTCLSCVKKSNSPDKNILNETSVQEVDSSVLEPIKNLTVSGNGWNIVFTNGKDWSLKDYSESDASLDFEIIFKHEKYDAMVFITREAYKGTLQAYVLEAVRGIKEGGLKLVGSFEYSNSNNKYLGLESTRDNVRAFTYFTNVLEQKYTLVCLATDVPNQKEFCDSIVDSFSISK